MAKEFLGEGWKFPVRVNSDFKIVTSKYGEDIKEAIRIILSTAKGERVMRPDFGCGIHDLVFSPINAATLNLVETSVREALLHYEPRIEVLNISVSDKLAGEKVPDVGKLLISVDYRVKATNGEFNYVFPFYLTEGTR
jgi:phage baseplate assembly protein W